MRVEVSKIRPFDGKNRRFFTIPSQLRAQNDDKITVHYRAGIVLLTLNFGVLSLPILEPKTTQKLPENGVLRACFYTLLTWGYAIV